MWQAKGRNAPALAGAPDDVLRGLMSLAGYDSATSSLAPETHLVQVNHILEKLAIRPADTVYEVGCGAGAMLYSLRPACAAVGGIDFADSLIAVARKVLDSADLTVGEAIGMPVEPRYDVVLSNGVFLYFPDEAYAGRVVRAMVGKARRAVAVLDVNDLALKAEFEAVRRARQGGSATAYADLRQLYLDRDFFRALAAELGWTCEVHDSVMTNSANGKYRFNALLSNPERS